MNSVKTATKGVQKLMKKICVCTDPKNKISFITLKDGPKQIKGYVGGVIRNKGNIINGGLKQNGFHGNVHNNAMLGQHNIVTGNLHRPKYGRYNSLKSGYGYGSGSFYTNHRAKTLISNYYVSKSIIPIYNVPVKQMEKTSMYSTDFWQTISGTKGQNPKLFVIIQKGIILTKFRKQQLSRQQCQCVDIFKYFKNKSKMNQIKNDFISKVKKICSITPTCEIDILKDIKGTFISINKDQKK